MTSLLTRFGLQKSRLTILIMVGLLIQGLLTYGILPKRENPAVTIRAATVSAFFPGMSPERMEDLIVTPLERALREIGEVDDISTRISTGQTVINVTFYDNIPKDQIDKIKQDVRNKMIDIEDDLPVGTKGPIVNTNYGDVSIATIAATGRDFSYRELWESADELRQALYQVDGIIKVSLLGEQEERIWLEINSRKLASVGVQLSRVLEDLRAQNVILPAGEINADGTTIILEANGDLGSIDHIKNVLTKVQGVAGYVRLEDIMDVRRGYVDPLEDPVYFNGEPAIILSVEMADDRDLQKIGRELKKAVEAFEQTQPIGVSYTFSAYQEANVTKAINNALSNVGQTFAVVFIAMLLFLGFREAFIIACIVPFTVMFALIVMNLVGVDIQQISIAAVIISLGLLVDNGLVIVEDIGRRIKHGETPRDASIAAGGQFFVPLAVASVTTVSAFIPMLIIDGTEGEFAFSLGSVVGFMLLGSWITAHYILPFLAASMMRRRRKHENAPVRENWFVAIYGFILKLVLGLGWVIIPLSYFLVMTSGGVFASLKNEMFPMSERSEYLIYLEMPKGTAIDATRDEALAVNEWLMDVSQNPEVTNTTVFVGNGGPRFYLALDPADAHPSSAFILVNTDSPEGALAAERRAKRYLIEHFPAARARVTRLAMGGGESGIVRVEISGPDADALLHAATEVEHAFAKAPGIVLNQNDWGNKTLKAVINIAQDKARELGVTSQGISDVMDTFFIGNDYSTYREGTEAIPIVARAGESFRDSIEDLMNLTIPASGKIISLNQVATFEPKLEFSQIRRENQVRQIVISGKSETLAADKLVAEIQPELDEIAASLGPQYNIHIGGETEDSADVNAKLGAGMPLALLVMLAALVFQFNSVRRVLLTFMTIPLIVIGSPYALAMTHQPMSFFATLGLISLMGIIINNAIVLIDQIDIEWRQQPLKPAIIAASKQRFIPILLTSLTTVAGLLPMAMNGGALFEPMATIMIGGLLISSPMTLFFVPPGYYLFFRGIGERAKFRRDHPLGTPIPDKLKTQQDRFDEEDEDAQENRAGIEVDMDTDALL